MESLEQLLAYAGYEGDDLKEVIDYIQDNKLFDYYNQILSQTQIITDEEQALITAIPQEVFALSDNELKISQIQLQNALSEHESSQQYIQTLKTLTDLTNEISFPQPHLSEIDTDNQKRYFEQALSSAIANFTQIQNLSNSNLQLLQTSQNFTALQPNLLNSIQKQSEIAENLIHNSENVENLILIQNQQSSIQQEAQRLRTRISAQRLKKVEMEAQIQVYSAVTELSPGKYKTEADLDALLQENQEIYCKFVQNIEKYKKLNAETTKAEILQILIEIGKDQGKILQKVRSYRGKMLKMLQECEKNVRSVNQNLYGEFKQIEQIDGNISDFGQFLKENFQTLQDVVQRVLYLKQSVSRNQQSPLFSLGLDAYFENFGHGETLNAMLDYFEQFKGEMEIKNEQTEMKLAEICHVQSKQIQEFGKVGEVSGGIYEDFEVIQGFVDEK